MEKFGAFKSLFKKAEKHEQLTISCASRTVKKERYSSKNEDALLIDEVHRAFGVLDGMGGCVKGDVASQTACDRILELIPEIKDGVSIKTAEAYLQEIMEQADMAVYAIPKEEDNNAEFVEAKKKKEDKPGAAVVILKIHIDEKGKSWAIIAPAGDCRLYKISKDGKIQQLTTDDDHLKASPLFNEKEKRNIAAKLDRVKTVNDLGGAEIGFFLEKSKITEWLGRGNGFPGVFSIPVEKGDRFLITSDGVHGNLTPEKIEEIIRNSASKEDAVNKLIEEATSFSRKPIEEEARAWSDDMSAVMVEIK